MTVPLATRRRTALVADETLISLDEEVMPDALAGLAADGFITHLASNGAAAIHDTELARFGHTSEDVAAQLADGSFGMASDTALLVNQAAKRAAGG